MQISLKTFLIVVAVLISLGTAKHFYDRSQRNALLNDIKDKLQDEKELSLKRVDSVAQDRDVTIKNLIQDNEKAKADSRYWYNQAKRKSLNPNYDIDFLTAAGIIAGSEYRPDQPNGNAKQGKND